MEAEVPIETHRAKLAPDEARRIARRQYREFDVRPPFSYKVKRQADYYPEIDERRIFALEKKVFKAVEGGSIPKNLETMNDDHPARVVLNKLLESDHKHKRSIERVTKLDVQIHLDASEHSEDFETVADRIDEARERLDLPTRQELMIQHRSQKQRYLECLRAFLSIHTRSKETGAEQKIESERFYHQTEAVHLAHACYTAVRSYIHNQKDKILRDDNGITMHHLYSCAVHVMNDYGEDIAAAKAEGNWPLERELLIEMKKEIVISLLHDFIEDLKDIDLIDLKYTLIALTRHETDLSGASCLDHPDLDPRPADYNFIETYWDEIVAEVRAVTKPQDKNEQKGYLSKQLVTPRQVMRKARDRGNNLTTLKYMQAKPKNDENAGQVQRRKILETPEILHKGLSLLSEVNEFEKARLKRSLRYLCRASLEEVDRLNTDYLDQIGEPVSKKPFEDIMAKLSE